MPEGPLILVVDNYDSFVYNLVQYVEELGASTTVRRNDCVGPRDVATLSPCGVLISPGPGHPRDAGNCVELVRHCRDREVPLLGVCLGHQALAEAFGGRVGRAPELLHGRASLVEHDGLGIFSGVSNPLIVGRYHSLVVENDAVPEEFVVTARSNGLIMGLRHRSLEMEGVQFHPESVLTQDGHLMMANWLERCGVAGAVARSEVLGRRAHELRVSLPTPSS